METFPFIVCRGRSGSTLLRAILDSHSQLAIPNESYFVAYMARRKDIYERSGSFHLDRYIGDLCARPGFVSWGLEPRWVSRFLVEKDPRTMADAIRATYQCYAIASNKPRYGDKTPIYIMSIKEIAEVLPEATFIHLVRDGRDSALSYREVPWGPPTLEESAFRWRRAVVKGRDSGQRLPTRRYCEIRYEDLISDPETVIRRLCEVINVTFEPGMLSYFERADDVVARMQHLDTRTGLYLPITPGLRDWNSQMTKREVERFESIAGEALTRFGYARGTDSVKFVTGLLAWSRVFLALIDHELKRARLALKRLRRRYLSHRGRV